jgi:DNA-binding transcriptional LysR family regulator
VLNFRQIEIFRAVMIAKSLSGAAKLLHSSQPGLSRQLKHLEVHLGFLLFDRVKGRLVPTREARVLFEEVKSVYKNLEAVDLVVRRLKAGEDEVLRLGASPSLAHSLVPVMLRRMLSVQKNLMVQFDTLSKDQVVEYLVNQEGDITLSIFPVDHPLISSTLIGEGRMLCAVPSTHRLVGTGEVSVANLSRDHLILPRPDTPHGLAVATMFQAASCSLKVSTYVRFAETALAFVGAGLGVTIVDEFTAMGLGRGQVSFVKLVEPGSMQVYLNRNHHSPTSIVTERFADVARQVIASKAGALYDTPTLRAVRRRGP